MAKKNFIKGIDSIFGELKSRNEDKPTSPHKEYARRSKTTKTTLYLNSDVYEKIRAISYWNRISMAQFINKALTDTLKSFSDEEIEQMLKKYEVSKGDI